MIVGKQRWRVQLQQATITRAAYNQAIPGWSTVATLWAGIRTPYGREQANAVQMKAELTHVVTIRWPGVENTVDPKMRFLYGSRILNILWINNLDERNRQLDCYCQELVSPP